MISYIEKLDKIIKEYKIKKENICIVGSSVLAYYDLRDNKDIDIVIKKEDRLRLFNTLHTFQIDDNIELVQFGWIPNNKITDDILIENDKYHFLDPITGYKIAKLELVLAKKELLKRGKDLEDITLIKNYFKYNNFSKDIYEESKRKNYFLQKIKNKLRPYYKKIKELEWSSCISKDMLIMQHTDKLFAYQYKNNKFNRYDIVVRYLAIEEFFGKNNIGFNLYKKMQEKRGFIKRVDHKNKEDSLERFKKLIKNIEKNGFDEYSFIPVDKNQAIMDGSHRVSLALFFDIKLLPIKIYRKKFEVDYSIDWFRKNDFSDEEINIIKRKKEKIFREKGIYFQVILWPPVDKYFDEIEEDIKKHYNVLKSYDINFPNRNSFKNFVFEIYESDDIEKWKIEKKLKGFENHKLNVKIIEIEIINPKFRKKDLNNHDISQEVEKIKKYYRNKYKNKIDNYFYDIIMHIGDNYSHTREIAKVLEKYKGPKC